MKTTIEQVKPFFEACQEGIYIADHNLVSLYVNKAYQRLTEMSPTELIGKKTTQLVEEGIISESVCKLVLESRSEKSILQKFKSGKLLLVTGTPLFDDQQQLKYIVVTARDVTELNRLKNELAETKKRSEMYLRELSNLKSQSIRNVEIIAESPEMKELLATACRIAQVDSPVLILGESGVGKEILAKFIHYSSPRQNKPLIKINCGAIPPQLLESELFGYEPGAFTDARRNGKPGMFELANQGTIFLDEIGELPLELQVKLLRVLQDFEVTRIGGTKPIRLNIRVITATNKPLDEMVKTQSFREDLYYRINVVPLHIPPLRKRKEDIFPLVRQTLEKLNKRYGKNKRFSLRALEQLENYQWPGNVRELQNIIERLFVMIDETVIDVQHLPFKQTQSTQQGTLKEQLEMVEKQIILTALEKHHTMRKAAQALGIDPSTLTRKCQKLKINWHILNN
ncbi:PAS domain S-box-containing protein [Caldalkalibacillus uzonensis]|uniref:PAS domain S-box-containing protein n=1 Tax=Caldalkalibacillus uzonensis TaxID=353224 RepID=A0ABU0CP07_9BACI|nr:sigma 54-interacting transcriptional regulator [Caldalkalibacillus uzonensis]MDQ0338139.1 PAS domain S-box-containing protein [Caldalkalibacillus uzonensis]